MKNLKLVYFIIGSAMLLACDAKKTAEKENESQPAQLESLSEEVSKDDVKSLESDLLALQGDLSEAIKEKSQERIEKLIERAQRLKEKAKTSLKNSQIENQLTSIITISKDLVNSLVDGKSEVFQEFADKAKDILKESVETIKELLVEFLDINEDKEYEFCNGNTETAEEASEECASLQQCSEGGPGSTVLTCPKDADRINQVPGMAGTCDDQDLKDLADQCGIDVGVVIPNGNLPANL